MSFLPARSSRCYQGQTPLAVVYVCERKRARRGFRDRVTVHKCDHVCNHGEPCPWSAIRARSIHSSLLTITHTRAHTRALSSNYLSGWGNDRMIEEGLKHCTLFPVLISEDLLPPPVCLFLDPLFLVFTCGIL